MNKLILTLLVFWLPFSGLAMDLRPMESVAIQDGGRKKPLHTFARESLQKLVGRSTWEQSPGNRLSGMEVLMSLNFGTMDWRQAHIIRCSYAPLKQRLGLQADGAYFSYAELARNAELDRMITEISERRRQSAEAEFTKVENEASVLYNKLHILQQLAGGELLKIVPPPPNAGNTWLLVSEAGRRYANKGGEISESFQAIGQAYKAGNDIAFAEAVAKFKTVVRELSPQVYPSEIELNRELAYNHVHPFRWAWIFYLFSFIVMLAAKRGHIWRGRLYWPANGLFLVGLALQVYGFWMRTLISGRAPVTNMYEVVIFMAVGAALFALIFEFIYRSRHFVLAAAAVGVLSLVLADNLPAVLDPNIQPLVPVLRSNYWLTVHVMTITLGYAAFMLALGIGHIVLGYYVFKPSALTTVKELTQFNYRTMQVGVLFLIAGTILGGVWANDSWGRFWGWDPKETWALIAILCYLVVLHGRFAGWMGSFALNAASVLCFQAIIMAAYGVNYVLGKGLHSYGFGVGGEKAVGAYVLAEIILVGLSMWRFKAMLAQKDNKTPSKQAA